MQMGVVHLQKPGGAGAVPEHYETMGKRGFNDILRKVCGVSV